MEFAKLRRSQTFNQGEDRRTPYAYIDLALMVAATAAGFLGAAWWIALVIGLLLTLLSLTKHNTLARRYEDVGAARVLALSVGAATLNNLAFAVMTFAAGRAFAWLVST